MAKFDLEQTITDKVIAAMESGVAPWRKGWNASGASPAMGIPLRHNGQRYTGINVLILGMARIANGWNSPYFMTFKQAKEYGGTVRKGSKSEMSCYWNRIEKKDKETGEKKDLWFHRYNSVFNADQIDGLPESFYCAPEPIVTVDTGTEIVPAFESFFAATGARIETRGNQPCYRPGPDFVEMPEIRIFNSASEYYATLSHEIVHWTGNKSRLDRLEYGKPEYAFEELVAELGALFVGAVIGNDCDIDNSAAYLNSWLNALRNDKRFIFKAAKAATTATEYLLELTGTE